MPDLVEIEMWCASKSRAGMKTVGLHSKPGGQAAMIVPLRCLRRLQAVERMAPAEFIELAEIRSTLAAHRERVAGGRPGAVFHERAMAELLGESCGSGGLRWRRRRAAS